MLCRDGQQVVVARSSSSTSIFYRVVFHGGSCGPWLLVLPTPAPAFSDRVLMDGSENVLRMASADYSALLLLPVHAPDLSSITADVRSSQAEPALRLPSLAAAASALARFPAASSFALSHTAAVDAGDMFTQQPLRSRLVVDTNRPPLLPGRVIWRTSTDVAVVPHSEQMRMDVMSGFLCCSAHPIRRR